MSDFDDLEDSVEYCVYCYEEKSGIGCCGENHFMTGKEIKDYEKEETKGIVYDPPMTDTEQYLLNKERAEEYKSYDY